MKSRKNLALALALTWSAAIGGPAAAADEKPRAVAQMIGLDGKSMGTVAFRSTAQGVLIELDLRGLPPGVHAVHVHGVGTCDPATKFSSAGPHFSPTDRKHGYMVKGGAHAGDLPNQVADDNGRIRGSLLSDGISLGSGKKSVFDEDGSAFIVHAKGDDYMSQPSGNAGDRLACGVIKRR